MRALVCGASKGIGKAIAKKFVAEGVAVTLVARNEALLLKVAEELGPLADIIACDSLDKAKLKSAVVAKMREGGPYHILINNSGGPPTGPIETAPEAEFRQALEQHLFTNILLTGLLLPGMKAEHFGRIINIISTSVKIPLPGLGVSNTTRGAVASWAKTLAGEVAAYGITVNSVLPGATETERLGDIIRAKAAKKGRSEDDIRADMLAEIPAARFGKPEEVAAVACFLASAAAGYVNGVAIPVDGGRTGCY